MPLGSSQSSAEKICFVSNSRKKASALALYDSILDKDLNDIEYLLKDKEGNANYLLPEYGITPLHCAVGSGSEDHAFKVVSFCLLYGGNPNVRCSEETTPVHIASLWGRLHILQLLLAHGGNPFLVDSEGCNAIDYAKQNKHVNVVQYLKQIKKTGNPWIGSPFINKNDAVTQTTILPDSCCSTDSSLNESSEAYMSCDNSELNRASQLYERTNSASNETKNDFPVPNNPSFEEFNSPEQPQHSVVEETFSSPAIVDETERSLLERGFICANLSEILSDIDSIDEVHTVSIYDSRINEETEPNEINNVKECDDNKSCHELSCNYSLSPNNSQKSCNWQDIGFIGQLPEEENEPIEELYTDDEAGIVLLHRKFPPEQSDSDNSASTKKSTSSTICSAEYDTDNITNKLKECKLFNGPVTKTTKKVYARQLKRYIKSGNTDCQFNNKNILNNIITRTFSDNYLKLIEQWSHLEVLMTEDFLRNPMKYKFRGGIAKCFFNYLLMDPSITDNLPSRSSSMSSVDVWKIFIESIFYVGKGKQSRPYAHLYEALKPNTRKPPSKKILKVLDIWKNKQGVVCLMIFHNIISAEALTREAVIMDALDGWNLTNAQGGQYHGVVATWNMKQKCQLGAVLLHRALTIYLAEGERQISPPDLEVRFPYR